MDFVNVKTTVAGTIAGIAQVVKIFGFEIPDGVLDAVTGIMTMVAFYYAKDKNVTGGTTKQNKEL